MHEEIEVMYEDRRFIVRFNLVEPAADDVSFGYLVDVFEHGDQLVGSNALSSCYEMRPTLASATRLVQEVLSGPNPATMESAPDSVSP